VRGGLITLEEIEMAKDAVATMGGLLPDDAGGRDAVHVAVFSAVANKKLYAGQDVGIIEQGEPDAMVSDGTDPVGVVDPFLKSAVMPGQRFWVYLYPRTITALSHRWSHPAFEAQATAYAPPSTKLASEKWLRNFCANADCPGYEEVMSKAAKIASGLNDAWDNEYMHFNDGDANGDIPAEFWDHVSVVLGQPIAGIKPKYFSCSC
jgi:hypothetical protein